MRSSYVGREILRSLIDIELLFELELYGSQQQDRESLRILVAAEAAKFGGIRKQLHQTGVHRRYFLRWSTVTGARESAPHTGHESLAPYVLMAAIQVSWPFEV